MFVTMGKIAEMTDGCPGAPRIIQVLAPGAFGGLEQVVTQLSVGLSRRGWPSAVAALIDRDAPEPPCLSEMRAGGVQVDLLRVPHRAYFMERALVGEVVDRWRPDVVHTHGYRADVNQRRVIQARQIPVVATAHGFTRGGLKNRVFEWLDRWTLARLDAVVAVSRPLKDELLRSGVAPNRIHLIRNAWVPVGPLLDREQARVHLGLPPEGKVVGWVGRLSAEKGPDVILKALARLEDGGAILSVVGSGREQQALKTLADRLGVAHRVRWHGGVPGAARMMKAFDLFCLSSRTEGTPMVLFEAMGARIPIIATRVGGIPEVLSETDALLVPSDDPAALATALEGCLRDPAGAHARAEQAAARLQADYDLEPWLDSHMTLYRTLARSS